MKIPSFQWYVVIFEFNKIEKKNNKTEALRLSKL